MNTAALFLFNLTHQNPAQQPIAHPDAPDGLVFDDLLASYQFPERAPEPGVGDGRIGETPVLDPDAGNAHTDQAATLPAVFTMPVAPSQSEVTLPIINMGSGQEASPDAPVSILPDQSDETGQVTLASRPREVLTYQTPAPQRLVQPEIQHPAGSPTAIHNDTQATEQILRTDVPAQVSADITPETEVITQISTEDQSQVQPERRQGGASVAEQPDITQEIQPDDPDAPQVQNRTSAQSPEPAPRSQVETRTPVPPAASDTQVLNQPQMSTQETLQTVQPTQLQTEPAMQSSEQTDARPVDPQIASRVVSNIAQPVETDDTGWEPAPEQRIQEVLTPPQPRQDTTPPVNTTRSVVSAPRDIPITHPGEFSSALPDQSADLFSSLLDENGSFVFTSEQSVSESLVTSEPVSAEQSRGVESLLQSAARVTETYGLRQTAPMPQAEMTDTATQARAMEQVSKAVEVTVQRNASELTVRLDPPELGALHVKVSRVAGEIVAQVRAESITTHQMIMSNQLDIRDALQQAGLRLVQVHVPDFGSSFSQFSHHQQTQDQSQPMQQSFGYGGFESEGMTDSSDILDQVRRDRNALMDSFA